MNERDDFLATITPRQIEAENAIQRPIESPSLRRGGWGRPMGGSGCRTLFVVAVAIAVAAGVTTASATPTSASDPTPGATTWPAPASLPMAGRVLFTIESDHESYPAFIDQTGLHVIPIAADSTFAHAVWAPGDTVVFDSERSGLRHLYRMGIDGGNVVQLTSGATAEDTPAVSADGAQLAFAQVSYAENRDLGIHIANIDGSNARAFTPATPAGTPGAKGFDEEASFSPDGQSIAFVRVVDPDADLAGVFIIGTDGTGLRRLTDDALGAGHPRWSPDGKRILFSQPSHRSSSQATSLWTVDAAGGVPTPLTDPDDPGISYEADWSPDGSQVVFHYFAPDLPSIELRMVDADGTDPATLWAAPPSFGPNLPDWGS